MNDPDTYELAPHGGVKSNDPRPNMWANPEGNWAKIELNGWNVHHTMGKNWARNANVHLWGWQFSDNHRSYVIKVIFKAPLIGQSLTFYDLNPRYFIGNGTNHGSAKKYRR